MNHPVRSKINSEKHHQNTFTKNQNRLYAICARTSFHDFDAKVSTFQNREVLQQNPTYGLTTFLFSARLPKRAREMPSGEKQERRYGTKQHTKITNFAPVAKRIPFIFIG
jgi:hypothetical protein